MHQGGTAIKTHVPPKGNMFIMLVNNLEKTFSLVVKSAPVCSVTKAQKNRLLARAPVPPEIDFGFLSFVNQ